jgi:CheY-like chemotaxis protein
MTELLQASIPKRVYLREALESELPSVEADPGQLQQVVMNLVLNAAEAIPEGKTGTIFIATTVEEMTASNTVLDEISHEPLAPGSYVCLEVRDNGSGIDEHTRRKIFDPFFSAKFVGRGLGLPAAAGVVKSHKGAVEIATTIGQGTTFRVFLPAAASPSYAEPAGRIRDLRGGGTVLVVDDETMVREMACAALAKYGYKVLSAKDGREAIQVFEQDGHCISAVLLDLTMPVMSGEQALEALKQRCPTLKVILMSGYGESEAVRLFAGKGLSAFIHKPFTVTHLAEKLKTVLTVPLDSWP